MSQIVIDKIRRWRDDPVYFVRDQLGVEPDEWQKEALVAFVSKEHARFRISLQACAGPGKSAVLAWCALIFMACYGEPGSHPKGAVLSITRENLKDNLWAEIARWHGRSPWMSGNFTWNSERYFNNSSHETWFLSARSWAKTANPEEQGKTLSGIHADYVLFLLDESGDIPLTVARAAEQALSSCKWGRIMQAGNPISQDGMLYAAYKHLRDQWHVIRITGDPDDPKRSTRIDIEWARKQIADHGRDNPWVMAYILGLYPNVALNSLLSPDDVEASFDRVITEQMVAFAQKRLGVDVALQGDDRTVIFPRQGLAGFKSVTMRTNEPSDISMRVISAKKEWGSEMEFIDNSGGYGSGVVSHMKMAGFDPYPVQFAGKATDLAYFNKRSEMWFEMAKWVKGGGGLVRDETLVRELTEPKYFLKNGRFLLEPKDMIKKRIGASPDQADALALTFCLPDMPRAGRIEFAILDNQNRKAVHDYDPFADEYM